MRTFSTLYKQLTGVFPEVKAKNASTETALDGTDWADINIDDILWGPIQALLNFVSQTPDGVAETYDTSQIFNAMREAFSTAAKQTISAAGPVVFGKTNHEVEVDLSLGNLAISQLPVPDFIGQKVHIYGVGSGIGSIVGGTGLYANDVFFTENTGGVFLTSISAGVGGEWRPENGVTADYVSGAISILQEVWGNIKQKGTFSGSIAITSANAGGGFRSSSIILSTPIAFLSPTESNGIAPSNTDGYWIAGSNSVSPGASQITVNVMSVNSQTPTLSLIISREGKY